MKDLHDAMQDVPEFQHASPAQDLADTISFVPQVSQNGNQANSKTLELFLVRSVWCSRVQV